jgi:hypothetical protein
VVESQRRCNVTRLQREWYLRKFPSIFQLTKLILTLTSYRKNAKKSLMMQSLGKHSKAPMLPCTRQPPQSLISRKYTWGTD